METQNDPLSQAANGINTDMPLIQDGTFMRFECRDANITESEEKKLKMLVTKWVTTRDSLDQNNNTLNAGFPVTVRILVQETEKRTLQMVAQDLAKLLKSVGKPEVSPRELINNPSLLIGAFADAKVVVSPEKNGFPASNNLRWKLPA